ncbi:hypothetical protein [Duganella vulcania]|uniref:Uncharacterized protein n=1 Tax=Duganella vulcania TaxID=2692166 RepID=A0A845GKZ6_9BURK|nr:hypothetical protein [Duganella vulcania]MYM94140.1 hypothetical protein [Duganella vulcania]
MTIITANELGLGTPAAERETVPAPVLGDAVAAPAAAAADDTIILSPVDLLYQKFSETFGNSNPMQLLSMVWPGTLLDYGSYQDDAAANAPLSALLEINQSTLFDQFYPIATVTQPDGTRVSDRYQQAIESYGPIPNEALINLQSVIRQRLDQQTTIDINGVQTKVSLLEKYTILQDRWIERKQAWSTLKTDKLDYYRSNGDTDWWEQYITWYEQNAESYVAGIDAAYNRMLADFPINEFEDALAILDTHDAAALLRAKQDLRNAATPVPSSLGDSFYSTQAIPRNWGNALKPSSTFRDLLADPQAQQRYMDLCIDQLREQIFAWNAIIAQIPDSNKDEIATALAAFNDASEKYFDSTSQMVKDYGDNTVTAVKIYQQYAQGKQTQKEEDAKKLKDKLDKDQPGGGGKFDYVKAAEDINKGQKLLVDDTGSMVKSGQALAQKATAYLNSRAGEGLREMIAPVLAKLQSQLTILMDQISNFNSAAGRAIQLNGTGITLLADGGDHPVNASTVDDVFNQRWSEITVQVNQSSMSTASQSSTSFSETNWGVDFFFGSAGGQDSSQSQSFATQYLAEGASIQIGMLATKVLIERPWMHPELFGRSNHFFKAVDTPVTSKDPISRSQLLQKALGGAEETQAAAAQNCRKLNSAILPGYPVAVLLAKDITIKMKLKEAQADSLQKHSERNSSSGGGFLCFSVSHTEASTADSKSSNSYSMGGEFVFRIPAPQIVGVWNQILPEDKSDYLDSDALERVLQFKQTAKIGRAVTAPQPYVEVAPTKPGA